MAVLPDHSSGDAGASGEFARVVEDETPPRRRGGSPVQALVERAYQARRHWSPVIFGTAILTLFVLFGMAAYFVYQTQNYHGYGSVSLDKRSRPPYGRRIRGGSESLSRPVLVCYYDPQWSNATRRGAWAYDLDRHFPKERCSHAVFLGLRYKGHAVRVPSRQSEKALAKFVTLKHQGLTLQASLTVSGPVDVSHHPSHFASDVVAWVRARGFDGLELDTGEGAAVDGYNELVEALSAELVSSPRKWAFSVNVYMSPSFMKRVNVKQLHSDADFLVLNTQNLEPSDYVTAAHSGLYGKASWNSSLAAVFAQTGSLSRLVPVVPFMSREFELQEPLPQEFNSVSGGVDTRGLAAATPYHDNPGVRAFFEVCQSAEDASWSKVWQPDDYCYMQAKGERFVVLEDKDSVICKLKFAAMHRLLGVALKQLDLDAFRASTECGGQQTLLDAVLGEVGHVKPRDDADTRWTERERRVPVSVVNGKVECLSDAQHQIPPHQSPS